MSSASKNSFFIRSLPAFFLLFTHCSTTTEQKYRYPANSNPQEEISLFDQQLQNAKANQVDVLSPDHYHQAAEKLAHAKQLAEKNGKTEKILDDLGDAKSHLDSALTVSDQARRELPQIVQSRNDAISAQADIFCKDDFKKVDQKLKDFTGDLEKGKMKISVEDQDQINRDYIGLEVRGIKAVRLGEIQKTIEQAKNRDAQSLTPQSLAKAETDLKSAEATIDTDRHNQAMIDAAVLASHRSADLLSQVLEVAKNGATEAVALNVVEQKHLLSEKNQELSQASEKERFNQALTNAQRMFNSNEAEVYRMGDQLLIRLKDKLPKKSTATLEKVKSIISLLGAEKVIVEGHTDSVGGERQNRELSEKRANTVAKYLVEDQAIPENKIEAKGYGFEKPLTSNKTKSGRAQNRRVDILIEPQSKE